jgi:hypothetical protein
MENVKSDSSTDYAGKKRAVIIIAAVLNVLATPLPLFIAETSPEFKLINLLTLIAFNLLTFAWIYYDSAERNQPLSAAWRILIVFFGIFALLIYLLKSRGLKRGAAAVGKALLIFLGIVVVSIIAFVIVGLILQALSYQSVVR